MLGARTFVPYPMCRAYPTLPYTLTPPISNTLVEGPHASGFPGARMGGYEGPNGSNSRREMFEPAKYSHSSGTPVMGPDQLRAMAIKAKSRGWQLRVLIENGFENTYALRKVSP